MTDRLAPRMVHIIEGLDSPIQRGIPIPGKATAAGNSY
jgi:hypothetical protein